MGPSQHGQGVGRRATIAGRFGVFGALVEQRQGFGVVTPVAEYSSQVGVRFRPQIRLVVAQLPGRRQILAGTVVASTQEIDIAEFDQDPGGQNVVVDGEGDVAGEMEHGRAFFVLAPQGVDQGLGESQP